MQPHQQRVVDELNELNLKRDKLTEFLKGDMFKSIDEHEQTRLIKQSLVMEDYASILAERIVNFK